VPYANQCLNQLNPNSEQYSGSAQATLSNVGPVTRSETSQLFAPVPVNLAALYYISYIYTGNMQEQSRFADQTVGKTRTDST